MKNDDTHHDPCQSGYRLAPTPDRQDRQEC